SVRVRGKETRQWSRKELAKTVGLVFQNPDHQIFEASVRAEVEFGPRQFGFPEEEVRQNSLQAIQVMDLETQAERDPFTLSKGERQRVAVASLLSIQPDILVLDEPTTGLDDRQQKHLMSLLRELNRKGKTILIVTHALRLVAEFCTYAIVLDRGTKVAEGHPREALLKSPGETKLPFVLELSKTMGGNALTAAEFLKNLEKNNSR
ncbi:MAG TPA: ABC transporter ATP-binding protein, partial [Acidobacteriota bacterium]|nr:ABC transporter ATP-binding protein [Acidobacteriota bacterium]